MNNLLQYLPEIKRFAFQYLYYAHNIIEQSIGLNFGKN